jgi:hypothetical protein
MGNQNLEWGTGQRGEGDERHGNNSNGIAKLFKMIVLIVTLVIKIMEYVGKIIIMIICYKNLVFNAWEGGG